MLSRKIVHSLLGVFTACLWACGADKTDDAAASAELAYVVGSGVKVDVVSTNSWPGGFNGAIRITNVSFAEPIVSFEVVFTLNGDASVANAGYNGVVSGPDGSGARTATSPDWLEYSAIKTGQTWDVGFSGSGTFAEGTITSVKINGQTISITDGSSGDGNSATPGSADPSGGTGDPSVGRGGGDGSQPSGNAGSSAGGAGATTPGATTPGATTPGATTPGATTPGATTPGTRVDNPYVGVSGYVNPEWKARADAEPGGSRISDSPTGVWMDRIAAIDGTGSSASMGLRDHLDEALAQGAGYIQIVIYNLPGRDCAALSSNGELGPQEIERYQTEYIDPIAAIESDPKYASLRIINIIEIDSLPNLVTNTGSSETATAACDTMKSNGNYQKGVQYALGTLYKAGNTYNYVDAGHHGWLGWDDNFDASAALFAETAKGAEGGFDTVTGFITNTANYSALEEPFIQITDATRQSKWIDWNRYADEKSFATAFRTKLVSLGFNSNIGMLIDTSRNGWGGPNRPTAASTASDVDTMISESRIDRRIHLGNWCNQSGAGLGERPTAVNAGGIDAYVWIKPPGESDGASQMIENDQGKGVDGMCDPTYGGNARNANNKSGALADSPLSGAWFSAQFQELMANAYPPL